MKTFVINLPQAKERLENVSKQLKNLKIEYEVFPAIYGKDLTETDLKNVYDEEKAKKYNGRRLTLGEIGCTLSHMGVWKNIVENNINLALVFEDDAIISNDIKKVYEKFDKQGTKYDYILLNYHIFNREQIKKYGLFIYNNFYKKGKIIKFIVHLFGMMFFSFVDYFLIFISKIFGVFIIKRYKPSYLAGGYFITKEGAEKLLKINEKIFTINDMLPEDFWKSIGLKFALSVPCLVKQNKGFESCIDAIEKRP